VWLLLFRCVAIGRARDRIYGARIRVQIGNLLGFGAIADRQAGKVWRTRSNGTALQYQKLPTVSAWALMSFLRSSASA